MASAINKVSSVLRIVRGERDALVRTAHFKAASENVSFATIERKTMSTKTSFKRVALVAVAALGLGVLSSVSASAGTSFADNIVYSAGTQLVNGQATVFMKVDTGTVNTVNSTTVGTIYSVTDSVTGSSTIQVINGAWIETTTVGAINTALTGVTVTAGAVGQGIVKIVVTSGVAGVQTLTSCPITVSTGLPGTCVTKTITWVATAPLAVLDHSTAIINSADAQLLTDVTTTPSSTATQTGTEVKAARIDVMQFNSADTTTVSTLTTTKAVVVSISGAGTVGTTYALRGASSTTAGAVGGSTTQTYYVYADNRTGTASITVTVDGVLIATKSVKFFGTATALSEDTTTYASPSKTYIGIGDTATIIIKPIDVLGYTATALTGAVVSTGSSLIATASTTGAGVVTITGAGAGTTTVTVCSTTCTATTALSKVYTVTVTKTTVVGVTMTFDKATYAPGEKMTLTVSGTDSAGKPIADVNADATRTAFTTAPTSNVSIGTLPTAGVAFAGGKATYTLYAPLVSGEIAVSGTDNADVAVTATATISGGAADAALDAANEATDAAYAAADAADNATQAAVDAGAAAALAQESADAALAAVTDLGIKVTGLLDKLSASLANIYKIIKAIQAKQK